MKPKRPTEKDLLSLVQSGFNAQLAKDREATASCGPDAAPVGGTLPDPEPPPFAPLVRMTLTVPEDLRYRLKTVLMNQQRKTRSRMTQDEFCAIAIADLLDLEEDSANPWNRVALVELFLQNCIESRGLIPEWEARARTLLQGFREDPCTRHKPPLAKRRITPPTHVAKAIGDAQP